MSVQTPKTRRPNEPRMIPVYELGKPLREPTESSVADSGARALVEAGMAKWVNRGEAIQFLQHSPITA